MEVTTKPDREAMIDMFHEHVCGEACPVVSRMMRTADLRRMVFTGLYAARFNSRSKRPRLIDQLCATVGVSRNTGWKYARAYDATRKRQVQE